MGVLPLAVLFMIASALALIINYPSLKVQNERIHVHAGNILAVVSVILAAGILTGILSGTKMVDAMANAVIALVPEAMGPYLAIITGVLSLPFTFFISNDAFYYGVVPILNQAASALWHRRGGDWPGLSHRPTGASPQPTRAFHLPARGPGRGRTRRPPALHLEVDHRHVIHSAGGRACYLSDSADRACTLNGGRAESWSCLRP
jgi:hypothetical protein